MAAPPRLKTVSPPRLVVVRVLVPPLVWFGLVIGRSFVFPSVFRPQAVVRVMSPVVVNLVPFLSPPKRLHLFSCVARTPFHKYTEQTLHLVSEGPTTVCTSTEIVDSLRHSQTGRRVWCV